MSEEEKENTKMWARARDQNDVGTSSHIEIGEIETSKMSLSEKNEIFHAITKQAQQDQIDEANP